MWADITPHKSLMNDFLPSESNGIKSKGTDKQMNGFTVSKISLECPIDKTNTMKELSFMQTKQNISIEDLKNIKMLSQLLNSFKKGKKSSHSLRNINTDDEGEEDNENTNEQEDN